MYEIWLMLNIAWEILLPIMPVVVVLLLVRWVYLIWVLATLMMY